MKRTISIILGLSLISFSQLFAQEAETESTAPASPASTEAGSQSAEAFAIIPELKTEEVTDIPRNKTRAIFKTNVKGCSILLNGNFQGQSQLDLRNLVEGYYLLRTQKEGYIPQENFIYIEGGKSKIFYIELEMTEETKKKTEAREMAREKAAAEAREKAEAKQAESAAAETQAAETSASPSTETIGDAK